MFGSSYNLKQSHYQHVFLTILTRILVYKDTVYRIIICSPLSLSGSTRGGKDVSRACSFESNLFKRELIFPVPLFNDGSSIDPVSMLHTSPIKVRLDLCFLQCIATLKVIGGV